MASPGAIGRVLLGSICLLGASTAWQVSIAQDDSGYFEEEIPVVLSASRLIQPIASSPASVSIIDAEMIRQMGVRSIADILRLVPGFQVGRMVNGNPIATYNGISERYNTHLQLIVDGRPTYVPLYGGVPWSELPLAVSDIERVEVTRAPNAATFGPNSFSAVVNIITRIPAARTGWYADAQAGGNDFHQETLTYHGNAGKLNYRFTLQNAGDEGFANIPDRERSKLGSFRSHLQVTPIDRLAFDIGVLRGGHQELDSVIEEADLVGYNDTTNAYTQFVWERSRSVDDSFRLQYYYNFFDRYDSPTQSFPLDQVLNNPDYAGITIEAALNRDTRSTRHEIELERTRRLSTRHRVVYGAAIRQDSVQGIYIFSDEDTRYISTQRVFGHSEFTASNDWLLNTGLLVENNSLSNVSASPRISVTHQLSPGNQFRLGYSRGTRTPLLLEEEGQVQNQYTLSTGQVVLDQLIVNANDLEPETTDVFDLGYYYSHPRRNFSLDAKLSHHRLRGLISTKILDESYDDTFDETVRAYDNRTNYSFNTLEFQVDRKYRDSRHWRASYTYAFAEDVALDSRNLIPRNTLSLFGSMGVAGDMTVSGEYYLTTGWIWDDVWDQSWLNRLDLRLEKTFRLGRVDASMFLQAELDLGNTVDYLERNQIDDQYFAGVSLRMP